MTDVQIYWRDMLVHLLQGGTGLFVIFAGWGLSSSSKFNIKGNSEEKIAAGGLLFITFIYAVLFPAAINYIYKNFLTQNLDETVLPYSFAITTAIFLSLSILIVALLLSKVWMKKSKTTL